MGISARSLRAMKRRWYRDLDRLEAEWPIAATGTGTSDIRDFQWSDAETETQRNLASAIAWIDGLIKQASKT